MIPPASVAMVRVVINIPYNHHRHRRSSEQEYKNVIHIMWTGADSTIYTSLFILTIETHSHSFIDINWWNKINFSYIRDLLIFPSRDTLSILLLFNFIH